MDKARQIIVVCSLLFSSFVLADTAQNPPTSNNDFKFSGYINASYNYLVRDNRFTSGVFDRVYDLNTNGFTLQQAAFTASNLPAQGFGVLYNFILGHDANEIAPYGWQAFYASPNLSLDMTQVYIQYATGKLTIIGGRFISLAGAEVIDVSQDTNFSRGFLDGYAEPFTHLGVRGTYAATDNLSLIAGVNNGWDDVRDFTRSKTVELGVDYTFNPMFSIAVTGYSGGQRATDFTASGPIGRRTLIDVVATCNATDKLTLIANADYDVQNKAAVANGSIARAVWEGVAGYVNYKFSDIWRTSVRGEIFYDQNGYRTGVRQNLRELTLTVAYAPVKSLEFRAETRHDFSNINSFLDRNAVAANRNNQSYALAGVYKF